MSATFAAILLLIVSPAVGSFLAVLADRLPRGEGVVAPGSACRACGRRLGPRDLVPIVSFAVTAGRCRFCGAAIPAWLLYMEIAAIGLAVIAVLLGGGGAQMWLTAVFLWLLLTLIATDLIWFRLPDLLTGLLLLVALGLAWETGRPDMVQALWGAAIGSGAFLALQLGYRALRGREGLGTGDVKLMAGLGAAIGPYDVPLMVLIASGAALAAAAAGRVLRGRALRAARPLPFGAALAAATGIFWLALRFPG